MDKAILANSRKQSTFVSTQLLNNGSLNSIVSSANEIVASFGSDSVIGQSYANLAKSAAATSEILTQLTSNIVKEKEFKVCHIKANGMVEFFDVDEEEKITLIEQLVFDDEREEKTLQVIVTQNDTKQIKLNLKTDENFKEYKDHLFHQMTIANSPVCPQCLAMEPEECEC